MSKYEDIATDIQGSILDGSLKAGDRLPTVVELCDLYGVSKITVRKAIDILAEQGLVSSRRGSGTYVKTTPEALGVESDLHAGDVLYTGRSDRSVGFTNEYALQDKKVSSDIIEFSIVVPPEQIAQRLDMGPDDFAYHDIRVRRLDDIPIVVENTYMPLELIPGLKRHHLEGSIYRYLAQDLGLHLSSFHRIIRAVPATLEEAQWLETEEGSPLLEIEQIGFVDTGLPFEYSISRNVGSRAELHNINIT